MAGRASSRLGGGLDLLGLGQRRRERPLRAQSGAGFEKAEIEGGASYAAQFAIGETLVKGLEIYRAAETVEETGSPYSASAPGVGRRLHLAFALSEGKCEALEGIVVDGEVLTGDAFVREADVAAGDGGGATYAATTARGGTLRVTSYLDAPDPDAERESGFVARGKTLRDASARMGSEALAWSAEHQGSGISWCHVELEQPVDADRLVWEGVPELGFLVKGMHLKAPGGDASTWSESSYTDSAAAVRYWWLRERRSAPADRIDMDTVRDAHVRAGQRIEVRLEDTVRYAWLAPAAPENGVEGPGTETAPEAPSGNEFLPERPTGLAEDAPWWSKTPAAPTDESPLVWRVESVLDAGDAWSAWDSVVLYQMAGHEPYRDVRPASEAAPVVPAAPTDGSAYVVEFDRYTEGLPAGINPGNREDPVRLALEADATSSRFGVSGVISAADDVDRVEEELDFAWAGSVVEQGGMLCFRPGADGVSAAAIDTSLASQSAVSVEPPPPLEERINAASLSLASSRIHGGGGYSLPAIEDAVSLVADGGIASRDLGEAALLSSPTAARRLLSTALRASQASGIYRYRVDAGDAGAWLSLRPGRQVTVTDAAQGFSDASMLVTGATFIRDTATVELDLVEQSSGTFRDAVALPVRAQRSVSRALARVEEPDDLELRELLAPNGDGTFELRLRASWRAHPYESTELQWRRLTSDPDRTWRDAATVWSYGIRVDLAPVRIGERYEVRAHHVSRDGVPSRWSYAGSQAVKGDRTAMAAPAGLVGTPMPGGARLEWTHPVEKDYSHTEIHSDIALTAATLVGTVRGTYFERYFERLPAPPVSQQYWVRHVDRSGNASAAATATVAPLAVVDRVGVLRDAAYLAQAGNAPAPSAPGDIEGNSGWTRKPLAPTQALPVVWQAYREAELDGEPNPTWSEWTAPERHAVHDDSTVPGFTTQVELQFQALDRMEQAVGSVSSTFIEPTANAPLVQVRQRFRASSTDTYEDWDACVHRWTTVARKTRDGVRLGVKAELGAAYPEAQRDRTIYFRSGSGVAPSNPGGMGAVPTDWSASELVATSSENHVYRLTVRTENGDWLDWSTAGAAVRHDTWTEPAPPPVVENAIYLLAASQPAAPADAAFPPAGWSATPLEAAPPLSVWRSTQEVRGDVAGAWSAPTLWAGTSYAYLLSEEEPAVPADAAFPPAGWSATELDAASSMSVWRTSLSVVAGVQGAWTAPENWEPWLVATFYRLTQDDAVPSAVPIASPQRQDTMVTPMGWEASPVYPITGARPYRWVLRLEGPARAPAVVAGFPLNDIEYEYEVFVKLHDEDTPPPPPDAFDPPAGWVSQDDGGFQQTPMSGQKLYYSVREGFPGGPDVAGVMYDASATWSVVEEVG